MNFLEETKDDIKASGHKIEDIIFIGSEESGHSCTWEEFEKLADVQYDSGFGGQEVATDLIIVFSDGAKMWRGEYDGSEWWNYSKPFVMPVNQKVVKRFVSERSSWGSLEELNEGQDEL